MIFELKMPQWGMNMTEGTITAWLKTIGDHVAAGEPIVEIESAKSNNSLESTVSGIITEILFEVDDTVAVQTTIALIECDA